MALFLLMAPAFAADKADDAVALITLENGATVRLNADFTWEYVFLTPQANTVTTEPQATTETIQTQTSTEAGQVVAQAPKVQPVVIASGPVVGGAMTASAMDHANLLRSTAKGGAKVSYLKSQ